MSIIKKRKLEQPVNIKHENPFVNSKFLNPKLMYDIEHPDEVKAEIKAIHEKNKDLTEEEIDATFRPMSAIEWYRLITTPCTYRVIDYSILRKEPFWPELETMLIRRYGCVPE